MRVSWGSGQVRILSRPVTGDDLCVGRLPTEIFNYMEVPFDHLDDCPPPATGLLVTSPGEHLHSKYG